MSGGILNVATTGVLSFQRSIQTISHNITNVNTEGYSRQRVDLVQRQPSYTGAGYIGNGVEASSTTRSYDEFLTRQVRTGISSQSELETFNRLATQVDNFTADSATSLNSSVQKFFNSIQEVSNDPTSIAARQVMLGNTSDLVDRVQTLDGRLSDLRGEVNTNIQTAVSEVNVMTASIADLNGKIVQAQTLGQPPNDLLDQRDKLIEDLSQKVGISVIKENSGSIDVFIGGGQPLVLGVDSSQLQAKAPGSYGDPFNMDISVVNQVGANFVVTNALSGGELGGLLGFRSQILDPAQNALGAMVAGLVGDMNVVHQQGYDLNGNQGQALFSPATLTFAAYPKTGVTHGISVTLGDVPPAVPTANGLTGSDYRLDFDGSNYILTRLSDNVQVYNDVTLPVTPVDGMSLAETSGPLVAGDSFLIQPTRHVAPAIAVNANILSDPKLVAASGNNYAVGDNSNALAMAGLANAKNLANSSSTYQEAYSSLVGSVATKTHSSSINLDTQTKLLDQAKGARASVSGVNLDEEAANLVQFQQSYQAAAQLITVVNQMFDALIGAIRG